MRSIVVAAILGAACGGERGLLHVPGGGGGPSPHGDSDVGTDSASLACDNPVTRTEPADGATGVPLGAPITVVLGAPEETVELRVRAGGLDVFGEVRSEAEGRLHTFVAQEPIHAGTDLEARLSWSCGEHVFTWRTVETTLRLDFASSESRGVAQDVPMASKLGPMLLRVEALGGGRIELLLGAEQEGAQDPCTPTTRLAGDVSSSGDFSLHAPNTSHAWLRMGDLRFSVWGLAVSGSVDPSGAALSTVRVEFLADARVLAESLYGAGADKDDVCDDVFGGGCSTCPGGGRACFPVRLEKVKVTPIVASVAPLTEAQASADPSCP